MDIFQTYLYNLTQTATSPHIKGSMTVVLSVIGPLILL